MKPYFEDDGRRIYCGDALDVLPQLEAEFIQCVVTSPPYWGLRKYEGEQDRVWGDNECEHEWDTETITLTNNNGLQGSTLTSGAGPERRQAWHDGKGGVMRRGTCSLCGAWRGAFGLEPTPELYVEHTVEYLRAIRRVLRKDGVVFWNCGDSYAAGGMGGHQQSQSFHGHSERDGDRLPKKAPPGLKPKDLCLIPFRVALAAQQPWREFTIKRIEDRAWLAGIVDADGCIGIHHTDRGAYHQFQPYLSVGCSDKVMIQNCIRITERSGSRQVVRPPVDDRGIRSNRTHYEWRLEGENAARILEDIYPHLVVKERQARIAHALWVNLQSTKELHKGKGHKLPDAVLSERLRLWELCKDCNQRNPAEVNLPVVPQHIEPGWYVRSIIIWNKPNPMPESVTDRPTESHEYILMLTKSARYYWDQEAVRETVTGNAHGRGDGVNPKAKWPQPVGWDRGPGSHNKLTGRYPRPKQNESFSGAVNPARSRDFLLGVHRTGYNNKSPTTIGCRISPIDRVRICGFVSQDNRPTIHSEVV